LNVWAVARVPSGRRQKNGNWVIPIEIGNELGNVKNQRLNSVGHRDFVELIELVFYGPNSPEGIEPLGQATNGQKKVFRFLHDVDRLVGMNPTIRSPGLGHKQSENFSFD